jgi:hypothetical protein
MGDRVFLAFLNNTLIQALSLVEESDVLRVLPLPPPHPLPPMPPSRYLCEFQVPYLRRLPSGVVDVAAGPVRAGLSFPENYLYAADPHLYLKVASMLTQELVHPNVRGSVICLGSAFAPGTPFRVLVWELYDILAYHNVTMDERNALNGEACRLLRACPEMVDRLEIPPLVRRERPVRSRAVQ